MTQQGSYRVESFATSVDAEIRRLNAQVDLFWTAEFALLQRYGLRDGMDVLDCGCGPGRLIELLKGQMPALQCIGLEMDPLLVSAANRRIAGCGIGGCRILQGTAEQPGLPEASFDFIILRLVLEHVPDPGQVLQSLCKLLRPGGRLVVIANDFEFHLRTWPPVPELDCLYEAYCASRRKDGGDPCIGRRLPKLLSQTGLALVGYEIEVAHNTVLGDGPFLKAEGAGIPAQLVRTGFLSEQILEDMTRSWLAMLAEPDHSILRQLFVGVGERVLEPAMAEPTWVPAAVAQPLRPTVDAIATATASAPALAPAFATVSSTVPAKGSPEGSLSLILLLVAEALGVAGVEPGDSLADLGLDSLSAITLQEQIRSRTGVEIPIVKLLEDIPVEELAKLLDAERVKRQALQPRVSQSVPGPEAATRWVEGEIV